MKSTQCVVVLDNKIEIGEGMFSCFLCKHSVPQEILVRQHRHISAIYEQVSLSWLEKCGVRNGMTKCNMTVYASGCSASDLEPKAGLISGNPRALRLCKYRLARLSSESHLGMDILGMLMRICVSTSFFVSVSMHKNL